MLRKKSLGAIFVSALALGFVIATSATTYAGTWRMWGTFSGSASTGLHSFAVPDTTGIAIKQNLTALNVEIYDGSSNAQTCVSNCLSYWSLSGGSCGPQNCTLVGATGHTSLSAARTWTSYGVYQGFIANNAADFGYARVYCDTGLQYIKGLYAAY